jgi:hypothetical protein
LFDWVDIPAFKFCCEVNTNRVLTQVVVVEVSNLALGKLAMASNAQNPAYTRGAPKSSRDRIREQFLEAIRINKPEVLASLAEYVLPIYRSVYEIIPSAMNDAELNRNL